MLSKLDLSLTAKVDNSLCVFTVFPFVTSLSPESTRSSPIGLYITFLELVESENSILAWT